VEVETILIGLGFFVLVVLILVFTPIGKRKSE